MGQALLTWLETAIFRRILHPSDFSSASRPAFRKAVELAKATRGSLLIAHVLPVMPVMPDAYIAATTYDELLRGQRAAASKQLAGLVRRARAAGARAPGQGQAHGRHRHGTHGRTGLKRAILGSVAGRVLSMATCPVLTVRAR